MRYSDRVLYVEPSPMDRFGLEDMKSCFQEAMDFTEREKHYLVIDLRGLPVHSSPESRAYMADNPYNAFRLADAIVLDSLPYKLIINFFVKFHSPSVPLRIFNTMEAADEWIRILKSGNDTQGTDRD